MSKQQDSWNVLQCLEHLNRYAEFYLDSINDRLEKAKIQSNKDQSEFKGGYFGNKFANDMLPNPDGSLKSTMKTFKSKNPSEDEARIDSLERFLEFQDSWLELIDKASKYDLNSNKCKLTIPLLKMNLGSTLRFVIYHQERHIQQAERAFASVTA